MKKIFGKKEKKNNLIVESKKTVSYDKNKKLQDKLLEMEDSELEALFEAGRITQNEYEYILDFRKRKKKRQKDLFEERIRCNNTIIEKVIELGRKFRIENLLEHGKFEEAKRADVKHEFFNQEDEQDFEIGARDKNKEERLKQRYVDRNSKGRGRERDTR